MPTIVEVPLDATLDDDEPTLNEFTHGINESNRHRKSRFKNDEAANHETSLMDETKTTMGSDCAQPLDESMCNDETRLDESSNLNLSHEKTMSRDPTLDKRNVSIHERSCLLPSRSVGTNECYFKVNFEPYVSKIIIDFQSRHPCTLRDYRSLSTMEKEAERGRISQLLARLGISGVASVHLSRPIHQKHAITLIATGSDSSMTRLDSDQSSTLNGLRQSNEYDSDCSEAHSEPLLSPQGDSVRQCNTSGKLLQSRSDEIVELATRLDQSMALLSPQSSFSTPPRRQHPLSQVDSPASSVELVRGSNSVMSQQSYLNESPSATKSRSKRLATTSGKRGMDLSRVRVNDDSFTSFDASEVRASEMIASPSHILTSPLRSPVSLLFCASQSPIQDNDSSRDEISVEDQSKQAFLHDADNRSASDTIQTVDCTMNYRRGVLWNDNSYLHEIPANVRLKDGVPFCLKPLRVRRPERLHRGVTKLKRKNEGSHQSLPDPLSFYQGSIGQKLISVYDWLEKRDEASVSGDTLGSFVFSMVMKQIIDVTVKLLASHPSSHNDDVSADELLGGSLIVVRSKEELDAWQRALREGTMCSVVNHATMPLSERKRPSTAGTCAGFDVVVTTYDAIKSRDIATPVDTNGYVVTSKVGFQDGWYASRSSGNDAPQRCEQLCILHQITWRRIVFVDTLGRRSYLCKRETARAVAGVALNSSSRIIFFCSAGEMMRPLDALAQSDRNAFQSVAAVLRLPEGYTKERITGDAMIDLNDPGRHATRQCNRADACPYT